MNGKHQKTATPSPLEQARELLARGRRQEAFTVASTALLQELGNLQETLAELQHLVAAGPGKTSPATKEEQPDRTGARPAPPGYLH